MRKLLFVMLAFTCSSLCAQVPSWTPTSGLVAYYPFNNNANNVHGTGNNGVAVGGVIYTTDRFGAANSCYEGNGASGIDIPGHTFPIGNASRSLSVFFKMPTPYPGGIHELFGWGNNVSPGRRFGTCTDGSGIGFESVGAGVQHAYTPDAGWHHLAVTYPVSGTGSSSIKTYFDGLLVPTTTWVSLSSLNTDTGNIHTIGTLYFSPSWQYSWIGQLDDIGVWDRALTPCEVSQIFYGPSFPAIATTGGGPMSLCSGASMAFTIPFTGGGTWSSGNTAVATIGSASGVLAGLSAGTAVITYSFSTGCTATETVTVNASSATITGNPSICLGATATLSNTVPGGTWSSSNTAIAVVGSTGYVTGGATGTATITYMLSASCFGTITATVHPLPTITGTLSVCELASTPLAVFPTLAGSWSSSLTAVAIVNSSGIVTGGTAGTANIIYTTTAGGCTSFRTATVNPVPAPIVSASLNVCQGATLILSGATTGGTWSRSPASIATITGTGDLTGTVTGAITTQTVMVTYQLTATGCKATQIFAVNPQPVITGPSAFCHLSSISLTETTGTPGTWSSSAAGVASVTGSGLVTGATPGSADITYTATSGGCFALKPMVVNQLPAAITGTSTICASYSTTLSDAVAGGTWSSSSAATASITSTGILTGALTSSPVTATITYNLSGCMTTSLITVNPQPVITGPSAVCHLSSVSLIETSGAAGAWTSSAGTIAPVTAAGVVTGSSTGSAVVSYIASAGGCAAYRPITVNAVPAPVTGSMVICQHDVTVLSAPDAGGYWSSSNSSIATVGTGDVTGMLPGTPTISYTFPLTGCYTTAVVTVHASPVVNITAGGPTSFCPGGSVTLNASPGYSYQWYNSGSAITGATNISYLASATGSYSVRATNAAGCTTFSLGTFVSAGVLPVINTSGPTSFCYGNHVTLTANTGGASGIITYQWMKNGIALSGATSLSYFADQSGIYSCVVNVTSTTGPCIGTTPSTVVTVRPLPVPVIHKAGNVYTTSNHSYNTYQWYVNSVAIPGANTWSIVPIYTGSYRLSVTDSTGCTGYSTSLYNSGNIIIVTLGTIQLTAEDISIYPNPANSVIHIVSPVKVRATVTGIEGKKWIDAADAADIDVSFLANGLYLVSIYDEQGQVIKTEKLVKN